MAPRKRANETEQQHRMDVMMGLLARGLSTSQLVRIACQQWQVSERQALRYLKEARERESNLINQPASAQYSRVLHRLEHIYEQALLLKDYELARRTSMDIRTLVEKQEKDQLNDPTRAYQSGFVDSGELDELVRSLGKTRENPTA